MFRSSWSAFGFLALSAVALLVEGQLLLADPPVGSSKMWPWNIGDGRGYTPPQNPAVLPKGPEVIRQNSSPSHSTLQVTKIPAKNEDDPNRALLVAHLPEDAELWIEDSPTIQKGKLRNFTSPTLTPGKEYKYTIRVAWMEDGGKVSQIHTFPIHAGDIHCIDLVKMEAPVVDEEVKANLAKLEPADRKLAEEQKFCAVQNGIRLGAMGVPVKVMVKDEPVFICCEGCTQKAKDHGDHILAKVKELKEKNAPKK